MAIFRKNMFQKGLKMTLRWLRFPFNFVKKPAQDQSSGSWSAFHFKICFRIFLKNIKKLLVFFYVFGENCFSRVSDVVLA